MKIGAVSEVKIHSDTINCVNWASIETIVTGSKDHHIKLFDVNKKLETQVLSLRDSVCSALDVKNDIIINGLENGLIKYLS